MYDNLLTNVVNDSVYCVFHWRVVLVEIHEAYKRNGYTSSIEELRTELDEMAGKVSGDDLIDKQGLEAAEKEKEESKTQIIDFFEYLDSFGVDDTQGFGHYKRYIKAYNAIYAESNIGSSIAQMLNAVKHVVNKNFYLFSLIRELSLLDVNSLGINKNWSDQQKANILSEYDEESIQKLGISKESLSGSEYIPGDMILTDPNNFKVALKLPTEGLALEVKFEYYLGSVVDMINNAKTAMNMLRASSVTGFYAKHIDNIIKSSRLMGGIDINQSMTYAMGDINRNINPDEAILSFDNDATLYGTIQNVYLIYGFLTGGGGATIFEPFDPKNYKFFIELPTRQNFNEFTEMKALTIDLVQFLSDRSGDKYGIMHSGGSGIQKSGLGDIDIDDIEF